MTLDLPRLRTPTIARLVPTLDAEHEAILDWLQAEYGWGVTRDASDPAYRLTRLLAVRLVGVRQVVADAMSETSLAYATGAALDHIGATYVGLARQATEADDVYRRRLAAAPARYAVGLSGPWYESIAEGVAQVSDARVVGAAAPGEAAGATPGAVTIYVRASRTARAAGGTPRYPDGRPDAPLLTAVRAAVTAPETRQQTDRVFVRAGTQRLYDISVKLTVFAEPDSSLVVASATSRLRDLVAVADQLGGAMSRTLIAGAAVDPAVVEAATITLTEVTAVRHARLTIGSGDATVLLTSTTVGAAGNGLVTVEFADPDAASQAIDVTLISKAIRVRLATDATGAITSTAAEIVAALNADADAATHITAALPLGSPGAGVAAAAAAATADVEAIAGQDASALWLRTLSVEAST